MSARTLSWLFLPCALLLLAGCPAPTPVPEVKAPKIVSFSATPADLGAAGGTVTLTWDTEDASSVVVTDSHRGVISGAVDADGTVKVEVDRTTLFVLTAKGEEDRAVTAVAQVRAGPPDAELVLIAQPSVVKKGGAVTLAWAATDPSGLKLSTSAGTALDVGAQTTTGSVTVYPEANTTWVIEAAGRRAEASVQIRASIESFAVTPASAVPGQPLNFTWTTTGASKVTLEEATGEVLTSTEVEADVANGSFVLPIPVNVPTDRVFNFRLRAEGGTSGVIAEELVTIYVAGQSHILSFELPPYARAGETFTARWTTAETDRVVLLADGAVVYQSLDAQQAKAGSVVLPTPSATTTYELRATSYRGGSATQTGTLSPVVTTLVKSATATPATIAQGGEPVTLQWQIDGARRVRIVHSSDGLVFSGSGEAMENRSITVLPNATGTYEVIADNTLGEFAVAKLPVTVTQPATFGLSNTGTILHGESVTITPPAIPGATTMLGFPHGEVDAIPGAAAAEFVDIASTGSRTSQTGAADSTIAYTTVDFETWLYGEKVGGRVAISVDGFFVFGRWAATRTDNLPLPAAGIEPFFVAPLWENLIFGPDSAIYFEVRGEAPNKLLIIQWDELQVKGELTSAVTFQAQVHQSGEVKFVYKKLDATTLSPTIGLQGPTASRGVTYGTALTAGDALTLFGERTSQLTFNATESGPFSALVKSGDSYLRVPLTFDRLLMPGALFVSEVMPVPNAALGNAGEWIEVANVSNAAVDLDGWTMENPQGSFVITAGANQKTVVQPGSVLVFGASRDAALNGGVAVDYELPATFSLDDAASFVGLTKGGYATQRSWSAPAAGVSEVTDAGRFLALADAAGTLPHEVTCVGTKTYGDTAVAQKGTPGTIAGCFGYRVVSRPVHYRDISKTGQRLGVSSSKVVSVAGTGTHAFGAPLTTLGISRNGYVVFNATSTGSLGNSFASTIKVSTSPDNAAAIFARSLYLSDALDADVYYERIPAGGDLLSPMGHWIVQWHRMENTSLDDFNFQLKVFDDGSLEYHYGSMESGDSKEYAKGTASVTWLENPAGSLAMPISMFQPLIRPHTAYRFIAE